MINAATPGGPTVYSYAAQLLSSNISLSQVAMADSALMEGQTIQVGTSTTPNSLAAFALSFLPTQVSTALAHGFNPTVYAAEALGLGLGGNTAFNTNAAWCLWLLGYPDQGLLLGDQALAIGETSQHGYTHIRGLYWNSVFHAFRREWPLVEARAASAIALAQERGLAMVVAVGQIMHGAARAMLNPSDEAVAEMRAALAAYRATGARFQSTSHLILLAQALTACGRHDEGLSALREAEALVDETGERYLEAEIHRLQSNLLLARSGNDTAVEASYSKALEVSRAQKARSLELRAASDLARLWAEHGERGRASDLLQPVYNCFTEGFDTLDLKEAKALLDALAS